MITSLKKKKLKIGHMIISLKKKLKIGHMITRLKIEHALYDSQGFVSCTLCNFWQ